ncbi:hypothetical protein KIPB_001381 [Kipferlia bialata]|uniref:ATP-dependent RNA helicase n=1 Tax=Kipferlia bialata TaxID=797122 RepID=A0A391NJH1_9EUKA|nr:hypothetical protein KIPB_001381 [Kipferlia bialata]|eukprot:g1381.t1
MSSADESSESSTAEEVESPVEAPVEAPVEEKPVDVGSWAELGIDPRLVKALKHSDLDYPLPIQQEMVGHALDGKNILCRAETGSGKTLGYVVPILQRAVAMQSADGESSTQAIVLVPTRELCFQVGHIVSTLIPRLTEGVTVVQLSGATTKAAEEVSLADNPTIIVATPTSLLRHSAYLGQDHIARSVRMLVVDEADLLLTTVREQPIQAVWQFLSAQTCKCVFVSATLEENVISLAHSLLPSDEWQTVEISSDGPPVLTQHVIPVKDAAERWLVLYGLLRLGLVKGRVLGFANSVDEAYAVKLFLHR